MVLLIIAAAVTFIAGIIFLSGEKNVRAVNKSLSTTFNKTVFSIDEALLKHRISSAICLLAIGLFCAFMAYWLKVMAPPGFKVL